MKRGSDAASGLKPCLNRIRFNACVANNKKIIANKRLSET